MENSLLAVIAIASYSLIILFLFKKNSFLFLWKQKHIIEIKYEPSVVSKEKFNKAVANIPEEDVQYFVVNFLKYLQSPIIKDDFHNYGERREWGIEFLSKVNKKAGLLYKSNKINRSNLRNLNSSFKILELSGISNDNLFEESKKLINEMNLLFGNNNHYYELMSFEEKKKVADKATEFAQAVCYALIKKFNK